MQLKIEKNTNAIFALLASAIIFAVLWARDYPKPMVDDLYYGGAALHMANGGDFSNPLIERQAYPSHFFFVYPPFHSFALFAWLKVMGVSAFSMTGFQILLYFIITLAGIAILRRHDAPKFLLWMVPLAVGTSLLPTGLRPETLSVALTMAGLALSECGIVAYGAGFCSFLLMFLGASTAPRLAMFSAVLFLFSAYKQATGSIAGASKRTVIIGIAAAFLCTVVIFLAQIGFRFGEFWHTFHTHAVLVDRRKLDMLIGFLNENRYVNGSQAPLIWAYLALLLFAWPAQTSATLRLSLAMLVGFILETLAGGLGAGVLWYLGFGLILFVSAVSADAPVLKPKLTGVVIFLFLLANATFFMAEYQRVLGRITMDRGEQANAAREMRATPEHPVLVDCSTARYIYGYRLPEGFFDIEFASAFPGSHIVVHPRPEDIYVIGPDNVQTLKQVTCLVQPIKERVVFGLPNRHFIAQPCKVYIIPAETLQFRGDMPK